MKEYIVHYTLPFYPGVFFVGRASGTNIFDALNHHESQQAGAVTIRVELYERSK